MLAGPSWRPGPPPRMQWPHGGPPPQGPRPYGGPPHFGPPGHHMSHLPPPGCHMPPKQPPNMPGPANNSHGSVKRKYPANNYSQVMVREN